MPYQKPCVLIFVACISSTFTAAAQPVTGIIFSKLLTLLTYPEPLLISDDGLTTGYVYLEEQIKVQSIYMAILAVVTFLSSFGGKNSYGNLGENVTLCVRKILYEKILRKNIGWFDQRDNGVSVLTSAMA